LAPRRQPQKPVALLTPRAVWRSEAGLCALAHASADAVEPARGVSVVVLAKAGV
jgi:hypothetical protein